MAWLNKISVLTIVVAVLAYVYMKFIQKPLPFKFGGTFHPDFQEVADLYKAKLRAGVELGSSFAAYYQGESLVDIWGGFADVALKRPWTKDTLSIIFSTSKGVTALLVALFVDRGWLDYNKPVTHYWPEFGQNGKDNITVALLISHQGGLSVTNGTVPMEWIVEKPEKVWEFLEKQRPIWPPGIELYNGLPNRLFYRAARHEPNPLYVTLWNVITSMDPEPLSLMVTLALAKNSLLTQMSQSGTDQLPSDLSFNTPEYSRIPQSSMNGYSNARNLAKLFGIVANGGKTKEGVLLSEKAIEKLKQPLTSGKSMDGVINIEFGYGVGIGRDDKGNVVFGHDGAGGQSAFADPAHKTGMAYVTSRLKSMTISGDKEFLQYKAAYYRCLEKYLQKHKT